MRKALVVGMLIVVGVLWVVPAPAVAGYKTGGGFFEVKVDGALNLKPIRVVWVWEPFFDSVFSLSVFARCIQKDRVPNEAGRNKVLLKNLTISSLDSDKIAVFKTLKAKMKNGDTKLKSWEADFMKPLHADGSALASVDVVIKGKVKEGHRVTCYIDVNEGVFGFTDASSDDADRIVHGPAGTGYLIEE